MNTDKKQPVAGGGNGRRSAPCGAADCPQYSTQDQTPQTPDPHDETISFRWGIPILDGGFTDIPNFFLDNYTRAGMTRQEFLVIIHLARYQFNRPESKCWPSMCTVAQQMGYKVRRLREIISGLEARGLLVRHYQVGETTVYDFSGFGRLMLELSTGGHPSAGGGGTPVPGGAALQCRGGRHSSAHEQEHGEEQQQTRTEEKAAAGLPVNEDTVKCSIHNVAMQRREKSGQIWYSHRLPDGTWCKGNGGDGAGYDVHITDRAKYATWSEGLG